MGKIILEQMSSEEFQELISRTVKFELSKFNNNCAPQIEDYLLTRKEVAKLLKISLPTLHDWVNTCKLTAYGIGNNRVRFKRDEIMEYINNHPLKSIK